MGEHDPDDDEKPTAHYDAAAVAGLIEDEDEKSTDLHVPDLPDLPPEEELPTSIHVSMSEVLPPEERKRLGLEGGLDVEVDVDEDEDGTAAYDRPAWEILQDAEGDTADPDEAPTTMESVVQVDLPPATRPDVRSVPEPHYAEPPAAQMPHQPAPMPHRPADDQLPDSQPPTSPGKALQPTWTPPPDDAGVYRDDELEAMVGSRRGRTKKILTGTIFLLLFAAAVAIGFYFGPSGLSETDSTTPEDGMGTDAGADAAADDAATLAAATTPDAEARADDAGADTSADATTIDAATDAAADAASADASATTDAAADTGLAFVIEEPEIPPAIERMGPRLRARRARRQRRIALRLHARMRYEQAEEVWRRAVVLRPDNHYTAAGLARTLRELGRTDEADAWQARADAASPMRPQRRPRMRRRRRR